LAKLQQRFTDRVKKKSQENLFVGQDQSVKLMGQGKDQMEVPHRQKLSGLLLKPPGFSQGLAFGTMAVTAGNGDLSITCLMESTSLWGVW